MQDDRLRESLANAVVRLFRIVNRTHNRVIKPAGVSAEQAHVLTILDQLGPMTIGQLQQMLALSSPTLTGAIDRLEAQGLVRRKRSDDDQRAFVVEALLPGKKRTQILAAIDEGDKLCFGMLEPKERKELLRLVEKCLGHLQDAED
jgi:DNA-binding MarR family transcriptional regulator